VIRVASSVARGPRKAGGIPAIWCGQNISSWDLRFNRSLSRQGRLDLPSKAGRDYPV